MKAIQIAQTGGPERLQLVELDTPKPSTGRALVQVRAAGVNFIDIYFREGTYKTQLPLIPGQEGAGVIVETGGPASDFRIGDRVAWCMQPGAYAEFAVIPEDKLVRIPDAISFDQAAAVLLQGMTAQYLATSTFPLQAGNAALVHAAAGGVGLLLTQMAATIGANVIATVSTEEKAELARAAGARDVILYTREEFQPAVERITGGQGVDVVYDSVGKATFNHSLKCLRPLGLMVLYGSSSGLVPPFDPLQLASSGSLFLTRPNLVHYVRTREELDARAADVFGQVERGELDVHIHRKFPLAEAAAAQSELQSRKTSGKLLLIP